MRPCPQRRAEMADEARCCPFCGAAAPGPAPPADPRLGAVVNGAFQVEAPVGQGGPGKVHEARHRAAERYTGHPSHDPEDADEVRAILATLR